MDLLVTETVNVPSVLKPILGVDAKYLEKVTVLEYVWLLSIHNDIVPDSDVIVLADFPALYPEV